MRYFLLIFLLGVSACNSDDDGFDSVDTQIYQLRTVNVLVSGQIIYERGLGMTEFLRLERDSSFVKKRVLSNDSVLISQGVYSSLQSNGEKYFKFQHEEENDLIKNCDNGLVEYMVIIDDKNIYNGSASPCNGPGYSYERVK